MCVCLYVCMYVYMYVCLYVCLFICLHAYSLYGCSNLSSSFLKIKTLVV